MKKFYIAYLIIILLLVTGCSQPKTLIALTVEVTSYPTETPVKPTDFPSATSTIHPSETPTPVVLSSSTPEPSSTVTLMPEIVIPQEANLQLVCPDNSTSPSLQYGSGYIIFRGIEPYALDMQTGEHSFFPKDWFTWDWEISPDEKKVSRLIRVNDPADGSHQADLYVFSSDGQDLNTMPWLGEYYNYQWLDSLHIGLYSRGKDFPVTYRVAFWDLGTGKIETMVQKYEDYQDLYKYSSETPLIYDPDLTLVVYEAILDAETGDVGFVLKNTADDKTITAISNMFPERYTPAWSPDGLQVVIPGALSKDWDSLHELFGVSRDGQIRQLTHLSAYYSQFNLREYSWSPNGRYIAFWLWFMDHDLPNLAVLDMQTQQVTQYCLEGRNNGTPIIWSPDSHQLVFMTENDDEQNIRSVIVDVESGVAVEIAQTMEPVWWLSSIPPFWLQK